MGSPSLRILAAGVAARSGLAPLFVYGTLRAGGADHGEMGKIGARYVGRVRTAPLYHLQHLGGNKTALVPGGESVPGELYLVTEAAARELEGFELGCYSLARVVVEGLRTPALAFVLSAKSLFEEADGTTASVAADGDDEPKKDSGPDLDPKWPKVRTLYQTQMKNVLKDLDDAVKHEDGKMVEYSFQRLLSLMVSLSKALGIRSLTAPLKAVMEKTFGKGKETPLT